MIQIIALAVIYGLVELGFGEISHIGSISFLIIGFLVSGIVFRIFKRTAKSFGDTRCENESALLDYIDIFFGIIDRTNNVVLLLIILYMISNIVFLICGINYIENSNNRFVIFILATGIIEFITVLVSYFSSKKKLIKCISAVLFLESFAIHFLMLVLALGFIFLNVAIAWILFLILIALIFLN